RPLGPGGDGVRRARPRRPQSTNQEAPSRFVENMEHGMPLPPVIPVPIHSDCLVSPQPEEFDGSGGSKQEENYGGKLNWSHQPLPPCAAGEGPNPTLTLVANSARSPKPGAQRLAAYLILPKFRPVERGREFATSI